MKIDMWFAVQLGIAAAVIGSLGWAAPPVIRHSLGVVMVEKSTPTQEAEPEAEARALDLSAVLALAPFGRAAPSADAAAGAPAAALPDIALKGILSAAQEDASIALIAVADVQGLYRAGDPLSDTIQVEAVARDHVMIRANGRPLQLLFDEVPSADDGEARDEGTEVSLNDRLRAATVVADRSARTSPPETTAEYISYWRRKIRKNPQAVLDQIGLEAAGDGYRIAQKHDRGVRLAGLQAGDLVRSVNGRAVGNPDEDRRAYDAIAASGQARLEVQRGDKILTFSFPLR
ncbi:hypothetical protein KX928_06505 [Roseobacter sp. YSTF-M11]|uniref:Type II secretion system protein GspC N-terminal domain-containing protein n=1 Tax=Roseobacter insulae TaxID=2859783 RepID=A0A9X1FTL1_9RHOB|nr:type II secretion system protein N [Roseobacter insulae]MBW4707433.1 hypothetical protein [Roseobacter insulae]